MERGREGVLPTCSACGRAARGRVAVVVTRCRVGSALLGSSARVFWLPACCTPGLRALGCAIDAARAVRAADDLATVAAVAAVAAGLRCSRVLLSRAAPAAATCT